MRSTLLVFLMLSAPAHAGPITKWDSKKVVADYVSTRALEDIERCLIDMDGAPAPTVYRQPDRPDQVVLLWLANNTTQGRVDLKREAGGTRIRSWVNMKQVPACAPS